MPDHFPQWTYVTGSNDSDGAAQTASKVKDQDQRMATNRDSVRRARADSRPATLYRLYTWFGTARHVWYIARLVGSVTRTEGPVACMEGRAKV